MPILNMVYGSSWSWPIPAPREPWADTTMYFKFDGNLKDEISWNTYSASWITYSTLPNWKQCADFPWNSNWRFQISNNLSNSWNEITLLVWFQVSNTNNMRNEFSNSSWWYYTGAIFQNWNLWAYYYNNTYDIYWGTSWGDQLYNTNEWHLYWQTVKAGWSIKIFLDGQKVAEKTMLSSLRWSGANWDQYIGSYRFWDNNYFQWKMSEFIWEKVERTEEKMLEYYNYTKANYWIGKLPSLYKQVEYVQSNGKCIVEVWWFTVSSYERLEYKFNPVSFSTESWATPFFFGNVPDWQNYLTVGGWKFQIWAWNSDLYSANISTNTDYTVVQTMDSWALTMVVNGTTYTDSYSWTPSASHFPLFCRYRSSGVGYNYWAYNMKLYYFKIYNSADNCVRDLVPCYRIVDSVVWLYDLVHGVFFTNTWNWTLEKWADVN